MANNSAAVSILKPNANGVLRYAPLGTPLPTSATEVLDPAIWKFAGYIHADGLDRSDNFEAGEAVKAYGGDTVVNGTPSLNPSIKFSILETGNPDAQALARNRADITGTTNNLTIALTDSVPDDCVFSLDFARSNTVKQRDVFPHMVFGTREDIKQDDSTPDAIGVTWNARKVDGRFGTQYIAEATTPAPDAP